MSERGKPTVSVNHSRMIMSKVVSVTLGDRLTFLIDKDREEIYITKKKGEYSAPVQYENGRPMIKNRRVINWIQRTWATHELQQLPLTWNEDEGKFIVKVGM
jgi:hypothetical protein